MEKEITSDEIKQEVAEAQQASFVMIRFTKFGDAQFQILKQNVNPAQVLGALAILELQVKNWYIQEENRRLEMEQKQQLSIPKPEILRP